MFRRCCETDVNTKWKQCKPVYWDQKSVWFPVELEEFWALKRFWSLWTVLLFCCLQMVCLWELAACSPVSWAVTGAVRSVPCRAHCMPTSTAWCSAPTSISRKPSISITFIARSSSILVLLTKTHRNVLPLSGLSLLLLSSCNLCATCESFPRPQKEGTDVWFSFLLHSSSHLKVLNCTAWQASKL